MSKNYVEAYKDLCELYLKERDEYVKLSANETSLMIELDKNRIPINFKNLSDYCSGKFELDGDARSKLMAFYRTKDAKKLNSLPQTLKGYEEQIERGTTEILRYSSFGIKALAMVLSKLIMGYEGRSYSLKEINYVDNGSGKSYGLVSDSKNCNYYCSYAQVSDEVYRGNIILFNSHYDSFLVDIYTRSGELDGVLPMVSMLKVNSHFSYVEEFIDCLISYKIKSGVDTLSDIPLDTIMDDFFISRLDEIKEYYEENEKKYLGEIKAIDDSANVKKEKVYTKINAAKTQLDGIISKYGNISSNE